MNTGDRIKEQRVQKGYTQEELANLLGLQKSAIAKYENGRVRNIKRSTIDKMSKIFDCSPSYLMGWEDEEETPSYSVSLDPKCQELLNNYNKLNDLGQHEVRRRAAELTEIPRYLKAGQNSKTIIDIDAYEIPASAGTGMFLSDAYKEVIQVRDCYEARMANFVLPISGDSMEPLYSDGDRVFVKSMPMVEVGEIGIFVINGDAYIKKRGCDRLISLNQKRKDIVFEDGDTIVCLGKVIGKAKQV